MRPQTKGLETHQLIKIARHSSSTPAFKVIGNDFIYLYDPDKTKRSINKLIIEVNHLGYGAY